MSQYLRIRWAIAPAIAPRPLINCNHCGGVRPYRCSSKFRVNANGKRIDAWLIYRCAECDNSWNFTILERRNRYDIEPALLAMPWRSEIGLAGSRNLLTSRSEKSCWMAVRKARPRFDLSLGSTPQRPCGSTACLQANWASPGRGCRAGKSKSGSSSNRATPKLCASRRATARRSASTLPARPTATPSSRPQADEMKGGGSNNSLPL